MSKAPLKIIERSPNPVAIEFLRDLLAEAESGELQELICVMSYRDNQVGGLHTGLGTNRMRMIGELEQIKFHAMMQEVE